MTKLVNYGPNAIMFGDIKGCGACASQDKLMKKYKLKFKYINIKKVPKKYKNDLKGLNGIPIWYLPQVHQFHVGVIGEKGINVGKIHIGLKDLATKSKMRSFRFGQIDADIPQINSLQIYGRNFPNGQGFNIPNSFGNDMTQKWGNPLLSGTLGREFGPGKTDEIYSNNYFNNIRMAYPGGDLDTALLTNQNCNMYNSTPSPSGKPADPVTYGTGMIYNSTNPQIVGMNSFGRHKKKGSATLKKLRSRKTKLRRFIRDGPLKRKNKNREHNSRVGINFRKNKPKWTKEIKAITKKIKQILKKKSKKKTKVVKRRRFRFGGNDLYSQMGPVPEQNYLLKANTFNNIYAGGGQGEPPRPYQVENQKLYIGQAPVYNPIKSESRFGNAAKNNYKTFIRRNKHKLVTPDLPPYTSTEITPEERDRIEKQIKQYENMKKLREEIMKQTTFGRKEKEIKKLLKKKVKGHKTHKIKKETKQKSPKIKLVKSTSQKEKKKQEKSKSKSKGIAKLTGTKKPSEGSTLSIGKFGNIIVS